MKTTVYIVYLKAVEGRFALPEEETTERNLLAHHFGRKFTHYGLLTKDQLKFRLRQYTQVIKEDGVIDKAKPSNSKPLFKHNQELHFSDGYISTVVGSHFSSLDNAYIYEMKDGASYTEQELFVRTR